MDYKINLLLFLLIIFLYKLFFSNKNETFINNNDVISTNLINKNYDKFKEIKYNDLDKCNDSKLLKIRNICVNKYIDLDYGTLKVPLYLYPSLYYHPLDEPN